MMMRPVDEQMAEWSNMAALGYPAGAIRNDPSYDIYRRAFRLIHFYRCPRCDEESIRCIRDDFHHFGWLVNCQACQWSVFLFDQVSRGRDDAVLAVVAAVPTATPAP
jgi:hypothetical protein